MEWGVVQEMLQLLPPEPTLAPRAQLRGLSLLGTW